MMIPPITDPLGRYWDQPDLTRVLFDDTHALMERRTFDGLALRAAPITAYDVEPAQRRMALTDSRDRDEF